MTAASGVIDIAVPVSRVRKPRRCRSMQDRLFDLALDHWFEWLLKYHYPHAASHKISDGKELKDTWTATVRLSKSNTEYSNTVLDKLLAEERAGSDWPASIHAIVLEFPRTWQLALVGAAMKQPQCVIAEAVGVRQQRISDMLELIKTRFLPALLMVSCTERVCLQTFGLSRLHLRFR